MGKIFVARSGDVTEYDMRRNPPVEGELLSAMLGPTGNLRAPTVLSGNTLVVGYDDDLYQKVFGS